MKIFVASFNRASDGAVNKIVRKLFDGGMSANSWHEATHILACGDRKETFEFCLEWYGKIPIIHLWAGEVSQGTHDEIYRWAITQMSVMQLCTNEEAKKRVLQFCYAVNLIPRIEVVGNVMLDNMPELEYDVVLYNPPTLHTKQLEFECNQICDLLGETYFWIAPNGDVGSDIVNRYVNTPNLGRPQFLALVKNCRQFISNSSCIDYEIKHILKPEQIVRIGERNKARSSINEDMQIPDATENIIKALKELE